MGLQSCLSNGRHDVWVLADDIIFFREGFRDRRQDFEYDFGGTA